MEHFNNSGIKINSYNAGRSGNHSLHSINKLLNMDLKNNLDIAVLMQNVNDLTTLLYEKSYWNNNKERSLIIEVDDIPNYKHVTIKNFIHRLFPHIYKRIFILNSIIFKNVYNDEWSHIRGKSFEINEDEILKQFEKSLLTFIDICLNYEIEPVLMTQANRIIMNPDEKILQKFKKIVTNKLSYNRYKKIYEAMNEKIREVSLIRNTQLIDLDKIVPKDSLYLYDAVHYTEHGSIFVSKKIFDELYKN